MKIHGLSTAYSRGNRQAYLYIYEQPFRSWLIAQIYYLWEKLTWPAMKHISKLHRRIFQGNDEWFIPLANRQDLRSYYLTEKNRKTLASVEITENQYAAISGEPPREFSQKGQDQE